MLEMETATDELGNSVPHVLCLSDEAAVELHEFAVAIELSMRPGGDLEHCSDWAGKAPGAAARIAGILHAIEHAHAKPWSVEISGGTMVRSLEIMAVFTRHSIAALDMMGADPGIAAARHVWNWIERGRRGNFSIREAFNALRGKFCRVQALKETLAILVERGYIQIIQSPKGPVGRRPSPVAWVRPDIRDGWR
jgi:hypothetical protein